MIHLTLGKREYKAAELAHECHHINECGQGRTKQLARTVEALLTQ